jgi:site-specific DNA-methyltransferase (adenine-specific)
VNALSPSIRVEQIGNATLYCGDCAAVLPFLSEVDTVVTSPPYNMGVTAGGGFSSKFVRKRGGGGKWSGGDLADGYGTHSDNMPWDEYEEWQRRIVGLCWSTLTDNGAIFYNHKPRPQMQEVWLPTCLNPGLPLRQIIIWARAGGINFAPTHYVPTHEYLMVIAKAPWRLRDKAASGAGDVWYIPQEANTHHPAPFPVALPARIIETTSGQTILDPFMGSGTTGIAAARYGRKFVGIEIEPKFFDLACSRISDAQRQTDLFVKIPKEDPSFMRTGNIFDTEGN